jgi:protein gp37
MRFQPAHQRMINRRHDGRASCLARQGLNQPLPRKPQIHAPATRERLEAVLADRNSPQKHVWRARISLTTAEGCGTTEVMRRAGVSKPCVWRWPRRFREAGVGELVHDKARARVRAVVVPVMRPASRAEW